jgi:hypothetical protein
MQEDLFPIMQKSSQKLQNMFLFGIQSSVRFWNQKQWNCYIFKEIGGGQSLVARQKTS